MNNYITLCSVDHLETNFVESAEKNVHPRIMQIGGIIIVTVDKCDEGYSEGMLGIAQVPVPNPDFCFTLMYGSSTFSRRACSLRLYALQTIKQVAMCTMELYLA